jgi:heavy metal response regulator
MMRILIIEDEDKIAAFLKRGLKEEGYAVDAAADGEQGYFLASTQDYDLIILDLMLPGLDGLSLCRKLRAEGNEARILVLTARDKVGDKVQGLNAGADDYLTKPFAFEELLARVRAQFRKREARSPTKLQVADLTMDLLAHKVLRAGREIELTAREFALLEFLIRNVGIVVTRTMIAEHVWDVNFDTFTNVIDVYMSYLRDKIDRAFPVKLIQTVRGRGYVIKG